MNEPGIICWMVMRVRRWESLRAEATFGLACPISTPPELGYGFMCAYDSKEAAIAACEGSDVVFAAYGTAGWVPSDAELAGAMQAIEAHPESREQLRRRVVDATVNDIDAVWEKEAK